MSKLVLLNSLDSSIEAFKQEFEILQRDCSYMDTDTQAAVNRLGNITLKMFQNFKNALVENLD